MLRDLPERLEEFTENFEDEGVLASRDRPANTSHDSDSERSYKSGTQEAPYLYSLPEKAEIAKSAREPRLRVLLAGSALVTG